MTLVFVYGTLKRGFPLHELGLSNGLYLGPARTVLSYPLLVARDFYGPMMLDRPGSGLQVTGELFEVGEDQLPTLDRLEDVGSPGSFRSELEVEPVGGGLRQTALGFMKDESWLVPLHSGHLADYQDRRFVPPWARREIR